MSKFKSYIILIGALIFLAFGVRNDINSKRYANLTLFVVLVIMIILYVIFQGKEGKVGQNNPLTKNIGKSSLTIFFLVAIFVYLIALAVFDENFRLGVMVFLNK